jgi:DNA-binding MarR family transcriptional regulator
MLKTTFDSADESPGLLLWRVSNAWSAAQRAALAPHGLTHPQFVLLASLTYLGGAEPVRQTDLAAHAGMDAMTASQVLRALEAKALVRREPHPTDARARALAVTDEGRELANRTVALVEAVDREFFAAAGDLVGAFAGALGRLDEVHHRHG